MKINRQLELKKLHFAYKYAKKRGIPYKTVTKKFLKQSIRTVPSLSDEIAGRIETGKPTLLARLGLTEGYIMGQYCEKKLSNNREYDPNTISWFFSTSGFFADDYQNKEDAVDKYALMSLDGLQECDYLSATFPPKVYIPYFFKHYATKATPTFSDFGPYFDKPIAETWVRALKGKKVLVINSFTDSIEYQYKRKELLAKSKDYVLPDFELLTYKTYVTQVGERPGEFKNFFQVLDKMLNDINKINFDVALIGAGAYGFPLSVEIKKMGKIALETCSRTPLFFGVYGERDVKQGIEEYMTEAWIRPMEEPPKKYKDIEGGCYW